MTPDPDVDPAGYVLAVADLRERRARAATPGPWRYNPNKAWHRPGTAEFEEGVFAGPAGRDATTVTITGPADDPQSMSDAEHIAAEANPAHALAEVALWRGIAERHRRLGSVSGPTRWCIRCEETDCPDLLAVVAAAKAYVS